ncbi:MAG: GAF domain-containing protein [Campylobacterota bacterium]|nr:GAF domain-containing protein [Campylobacterota bacterium]
MSDKLLINKLTNLKHLLSNYELIDENLKAILTTIKEFTNSDAATIYRLNQDNSALEFIAVQTDSLFLDLAKSDNNIPWPDLELYDENNNPNNINASVVCLLNNKIFNIPDVYKYDDFDFEGPKAFDQFTGYETRSMLILPITNNDNKNIGILQLINKKDTQGDTISFTKEEEKVLFSILS